MGPLSQKRASQVNLPRVVTFGNIDRRATNLAGASPPITHTSNRLYVRILSNETRQLTPTMKHAMFALAAAAACGWAASMARAGECLAGRHARSIDRLFPVADLADVWRQPEKRCATRSLSQSKSNVSLPVSGRNTSLFATASPAAALANTFLLFAPLPFYVSRVCVFVPGPSAPSRPLQRRRGIPAQARDRTTRLFPPAGPTGSSTSARGPVAARTSGVSFSFHLGPGVSPSFCRRGRRLPLLSKRLPPQSNQPT